MNDCCPTCGHALPNRLVVDIDRNVATRHGRTVKLPAQLATILYVLNRNFGKLTSHGELSSALWGGSEGPETEPEVIRVNISMLRKRVEPLGLVIQNIPRRGYAVVDAAMAESAA